MHVKDAGVVSCKHDQRLVSCTRYGIIFDDMGEVMGEVVTQLPGGITTVTVWSAKTSA